MGVECWLNILKESKGLFLLLLFQTLSGQHNPSSNNQLHLRKPTEYKQMEKRVEGESSGAAAGVGPENSNQINVSVKKNPNFYVFLGKKYLETHETIELHALGNAVSTSVIASENLVR